MFGTFLKNRCNWLNFAILLGLLALSFGCTYQSGEPVDQDPVTRKFTWFSYLDGGDIRNECSGASPLQVRAVYNGVYDEQVRTYDVRPRAGEEGAYDLSVRVIGEADLSEMRVEGWANLLDPWRGKDVKTILRQEDAGLLVRALKADGAMGPSPQGMELHSDDFYWIVSGCIEGQNVFHAYKWPEEPFVGAQFSGLLQSWDMTGVPVNPPRKVFDVDDPTRRPKETRSDFQVRVGENGLWGIGR